MSYRELKRYETGSFLKKSVKSTDVMYIDFFILRKQLVFLQWQIQFYMEINIFCCDLRHEYETAEPLILFEDTMLANILYDFWITCRPAIFCFA